MIISKTPEHELIEFEKLIYQTNKTLNEDAKIRESYYLSRTAQKLEKDVFDIMTSLATGTSFENTIELISGVKFPDVIAKKLYGVEVKSSIQNHWTTAGNSLLEGNRVTDVERIFMLFGKLVSPIQFKCKPYEKCLSDIRVTHSPRYMIDMDLEEGNTIFDKLQIEYDELRLMENPIAPVVNYYKTRLKDGESLWWIDNTSTAPMTVKLWSALNTSEKNNYIIQGMCFYPEIFGNSNKKYNRFTLDLVTREGVISTSMRDSFTAGGKRDIVTRNGLFKSMPRIYELVMCNITSITELINATDNSYLEKQWDIKISKNKIKDWVNIVSQSSSDKRIEAFLNSII